MMYANLNGQMYLANGSGAARKHQKLRRSKKSLDNWYEIKNALSNKEFQLQQQQQLLLEGPYSDRNSYYSNDQNSTSNSTSQLRNRPKTARKGEKNKHHGSRTQQQQQVNRFIPIGRPRHRASHESSELSSNNLTCSDLDTISNNSYSDIKLQRKTLIKAILKEDVDLLKNLLPQHDLLSIKDKHRNTLMHIACGFGRLKSAQLLMKMCPKLIDQIDDKGHNPIDVAIKHGQIEIIKWIFTKTNKLIDDYKLDHASAHRRTYLHFAAKHGENEILRFILTEMYKHQLSLDLQDSNGNTAAHLAAKYNHLDCLQTLVEFNCDVTVVNKSGHTPCFVAEFFGNEECVHYLMIVETCINLSIKVVKLSRRLRETKSNNEILKAQMDEAIAINNDFINQRENVMNISLDLMQRQLNQLETRIFSEIDKLQLENQRLNGHIHDLIAGGNKSAGRTLSSRAPPPPPPPPPPYKQQTEIEIEIENFDPTKGYGPGGGRTLDYDSDENSIQRVDKEITTINFDENQVITEANHTIETINLKNKIKTEIIYCKEELLNTKENCTKVLKMDQKKLDSVKSRFNQIKSCIDAEANQIKSGLANYDHNEILETKEHFEVLRKMYQEATHKLMIFRNALKERQVNPKFVEAPALHSNHPAIFLDQQHYKMAPRASSELSPTSTSTSSNSNSNSSSQTLQSSSIINGNEANMNQNGVGLSGVLVNPNFVDPNAANPRSNFVNVQLQLANRNGQQVNVDQMLRNAHLSPRVDSIDRIVTPDSSRRSGASQQNQALFSSGNAGEQGKKRMEEDELTHSSEILEAPAKVVPPGLPPQFYMSREGESSSHSNVVPQSFDCRAQFEYSSDEDDGEGDVDGILNEYNDLDDGEGNVLNARIGANENMDEDYLQYSIEEDENVDEAENIFSQYEAYQKSKSASSTINGQDPQQSGAADFQNWRVMCNKISPYHFNMLNNASNNVNQQPVMYRRSDHKNYNQFNLNEVIIEEEEEEEDEEEEDVDEETETPEENESPELDDEEDVEGNQEVAEINVTKNSELLQDLSKHSTKSSASRKLGAEAVTAKEAAAATAPVSSVHVNLSMNSNNGSASSRSSQSSSSMSNHSIKSAGSGAKRSHTSL